MHNSSFLSKVGKPARYLGCEHNSSRRAVASDWSCVLVFPDLYEIGMSHQGLSILYHILNSQPGIAAERCYCPAPDAETLLRTEALPLTSLESGRPLGEFDLIGITIPHELSYTNILTILDRAGIPFQAERRGEDQPLVVGGGTCAFNPEPVAEFFDAILLGDGEDAILDIANLLRYLKKAGASRREARDRLADVEGIYLPHRYRPTYDEEGRILAVTGEPGSPPHVSRRVLARLDDIDHLTMPLVPNAKIVHDRLGVEVARGCTRGCRFCQAGITYRPVRERRSEDVLELAARGIDNSGFDEIALLSLSTGDYSCLGDILPQLMRRFADERVSVALPSLRVGTLTREMMDEIGKVRKTGFTLAPEAGSERLRQAINKGITEADLLATAAAAYSLGWNLIKLYFMIGLPTETDEDIEAIAELARKTARAGQVTGRDRKRVTVSVGTFVPKPHTPFQWERQLDMETAGSRLRALKAALRGCGITLKYHDPEQSFLEGVFARGDRRLAPLVVKAWKDGARLDSWSDYFDLQRWQNAARECGIDLAWYLRPRDEDEVLPWHHLDCRVTTSFLLEERRKSRDLLHTPDCRRQACQKCGICDFKEIRPVVHKTAPAAMPGPGPTASSGSHASAAGDGHFKYFVTYSKTGPICFLGHLEVLQVIQRSLRRAGIRTNYSQGFNPSPKLSFGPALPVGTESLCEFFVMDLPQPLKDRAARAERLSGSLPPGISIISIEPHRGGVPRDILCRYELTVPFALAEDEISRLDRFLAAEEVVLERERKGKRQRLDIRALLPHLEMTGPRLLTLSVLSRSGVPGIKPLSALAAILERDEAELVDCRVRKTSWAPWPA